MGPWLLRLAVAGLLAGAAAGTAARRGPAGAIAQRALDWPCFGNDPGAMRFSSLTQICRDNVRDLRVAWTYHTGDSDGERPLQCTPLVVEGMMYVSTVQAEIAALDPATGREKWRYRTGTDPKRS